MPLLSDETFVDQNLNILKFIVMLLRCELDDSCLQCYLNDVDEARNP
jgi:hypothetical protein